MTARPSRFHLRIPQRVLEQLKLAPPWVREVFHELMSELEAGAYPDQHACVAKARGTDQPNSFVAWKDGVHVLYFITLDQPVIVVVGVHWRSDPDDGGDGGEPLLDASYFSLAAA